MADKAKFRGYFIRQTEKAILMSETPDTSSHQQWIPRSVIDYLHRVPSAEGPLEITFTVSGWFESKVELKEL